MASQGKDKNKGSYGTPLEFLRPVNKIWPLVFDLAADRENNVIGRLAANRDVGSGLYFSKLDNSLAHDWAALTARLPAGGWLWLNPPFSHLDPWMEKCAEESAKGARIVSLVPQGSQNWNRDWCQSKSLELRLLPRMRFVGETDLYPKDLSLFVFGSGLTGTGFWDWRNV